MRKILCSFLAALMILPIITGCNSGDANKEDGGDDAKTTEAVADADEKDSDSGDAAVIRFMTWEGEAMNEAILATFDGAIPGVEVELEPTPLADYGVKIQEMLAAGIAPDVFLVGNDMALNFFAEDLTLDLAPYLEDEKEFLDGFYPGTLTTYQVGDAIVGLPALINLYGIFYNKKYFDDAGIAIPPQDWTMEDMLSIAEQLKDEASNRYGLYQTGNDVFRTSIYAASKDGNSFTDAIYPVTSVQASDSLKEGITMMAEAIKSKAVTEPTYDAANINGAFMQGAIPMLNYGQWAADELIRNAPEDLEWGFLPYPRVNKNAQLLDATGYSINKNSKDLDAAFKVLKYMETDSYKVVLAKTPVAPPAYQPAAEGYYNTLKENGHEDLSEGMDYMLNAEIKLPVRFLNTWAPKANKFLDADWNSFIIGDRDVADLEKAIIEPINEVINEG